MLEEVVSARKISGRLTKPALLGVSSNPLFGIIELVINFITAITTPCGILGAVSYKLIQGFILDGIYGGTSSLGIHEVAHINAALVNEQISDVLILHHVSEETGGWFRERP